MKTQEIENKIKLAGRVVDIRGVKHGADEFTLATRRRSGVIDLTRVENRSADIMLGQRIAVTGTVRTRNYFEDGKSKLHIYVAADSVGPAGKEDANEVTLSGYICKPSVTRSTPLTDRLITDLLVASNQNYIPTVAWNKNAHIAAECAVGDAVRVTGRLQSREYTKPGEQKSRTAYELSAAELEVVG